MADEKRELTAVLKGRDEGLSRVLKNAGDSADKAHDNLDGMRVGLDKLDKKIGDTKTTIEGLRREIAKSGDLQLFGDLNKQTARLKALTRQRGLLDFGEIGREGGKSFLAKFTDNIKELPLQIKGHMLAGAIIGGAAAAPVLAGAISGAVTAGLASGVVAGGIALAAQDPRVKSAAGDLGDTLKTELTAAASAFIPETLTAIQIIKREFLDLRPELRAIFDDAARYVQPLTLAVTGFVREMVPGIREAVRNARPLVEMLSTAIPSLGRTIGNVFATMSQNAETSAAALRSVLALTELTLGGTAGTLNLLNQIAPFVSGNLFALGKAMEDGEAKSKLLADAQRAAAEAERQHGLAAGALTSLLLGGTIQALALADAVRGLVDANHSAFDAQTRFEESIDNLTAALKANGKTLDENTPKGRANRDALSDLARATIEARDAAVTAGKSQTEINGIMDRGYTKFVAAATAMGLSKTKARELATALGLIPPDTKANTSTNAKETQKKVEELARKAWETAKNNYRLRFDANTAPAFSEIRALKKYIATVPKYIRVTIEGNVVVKGGQILRAKGGPVEGRGPKGVDSVPMLAAPGEHVLTAKEVDAAGGHKAIEAWRKSLLRGSAPVSVVASATSSGGGTVNNYFTINVPSTANPAEVGRQVVDAIKAYENRSGRVWARA